MSAAGHPTETWRSPTLAVDFSGVTSVVSQVEPRQGEQDAAAGSLPAGFEVDVRDCASRIDREIAGMLDAEVEDAWMRGAIGYQFGWSDGELAPLPADRRAPAGKRLRPLLAVLSFQSALVVREDGGEAESVDLDDVTAFAAAVELVHNFSLIHDDIQDGDSLRRGRPTLSAVCGPAQALNVGDCVHALAFGCLGRLQARGVEQSLLGELVRALAKGTVDMTIGQRRDMAYETTLEVDGEMYSSMIAGKTAALMACATYGGALLALGDRGRAARERTAGYAEFGRHLGLCFQIRDDILGIWGAEAQTGKPTGSDIRRRKKSLPVVLALREASGEARERLQFLYALPGELDEEQESEVRRTLDGCDAAGLCQCEAEIHAQRALLALDGAAAGLQTNRFLEALRGLTGSLTVRSG